MDHPKFVSLGVAATLVMLTLVASADPKPLLKPVERRLVSNALFASSEAVNDWHQFQENGHAKYAGDDDPTTAWIEGADGVGTGQWLRLAVASLPNVSRVRLRLRNGYQKSDVLFAANARAKDITVTALPGGQQNKFTLNDAQGWQEVAFAFDDLAIAGVQIEINSVYEGNKTKDLALSDVQIFVTSTTPVNAAFEKRKMQSLRAWRSARVAAAKAFASGSLPAAFLTDYVSSGTNSGRISQLMASVGDRKEFRDWQTDIATARELFSSLLYPELRGGLEPVRLTGKGSKFPVVDGFVQVAISNTAWVTPAIALPHIDSTALLIAENIGAVANKSQVLPRDFSLQATCRGTAVWALRGTGNSAANASQVTALVIADCGKEDANEGRSSVNRFQVLIYGADGKLRLTLSPDIISGYRWGGSDAKPVIVGGVAISYAGLVTVSSKSPAPAPALNPAPR